MSVDESNFTNRPWHVSTSWFIVTDQTITGVRDFITSTTPDYRSECTAEICRCLAALQITDKLFVGNEDATKINLHIASDCLGVIRKIEKHSKVVSMSTKLHPMIREFLYFKVKEIKVPYDHHSRCT